MSDDKGKRIRRGRETGRALLGADRWARVEQGLQEANPDLADYILEWAYGEVYQRPALDLRTREVVAITCLTLLGLAEPLKTHVLAGRQAGLSEEEVMEVFIHLGLFAGLPRALFGVQTARQVLKGAAGGPRP